MIGYGADYNLEQWPETVWAEDVRLMREAGVNLVTVGVFGWSSLQPAPGRFTFGWLDRALELLHAAGIRVILATPTASPPPWLTRAHPEALPVNADGVRLSPGSRDTYCVHAPAYHDASVAVAAALADRYAHHPALAMWHVHNEYGTGCHCDLADAAFRAWLAARYGDLAALNEAWTTAFWSQGYADWAEVTTPRSTRYLPNPTQALDYRRFLSASLKAHYTAQRDVLRAANPAIPVTTNLAFGGWVPIDVWDWAADLDAVAVDCYPTQAGPDGAEEAAFQADLARGIASSTSGHAGPGGPRPWLLMEQAADLVYPPGRMRARPPGELVRHSLVHVSRGAEAILHFQWRASPGGAELWHAAMLPHAGPRSPAFREVRELGTLLAALPAAGSLGAPAPAPVAIVWDPQAWWALQAPGLPAADIDYLDGVRRVHSAVSRWGIPVALVPPGAELAGYRAVLVPGLYCVGDADAANLTGFAGTLAVWYLSGLVDERLRVRTGGHPGAFRDRLGIRVEQLLPQPPGVEWVLSSGARATHWREAVVCEGAEAVATHPDGSPAVTRYRDAWYVSTRLDPAGLTALLGGVLDAAGIARPAEPLPPGVAVTRRGDLTVALNHGATPVTLPLAGDLLAGDLRASQVAGHGGHTGSGAGPHRQLPPGGYAVLRDPAGDDRM